MTTRFLSLFLAFCCVAGAAAPVSAQSGSARDFQLPPAPVETSTPNVQGPVDLEGPVPIGPRVIPTETPPDNRAPTPTPTASTPIASPSPAPTRSAPNAAPAPVTRSPTPQPRRQAAQPSQQRTPDPQSASGTISSPPAELALPDDTAVEPSSEPVLPAQQTAADSVLPSNPVAFDASSGDISGNAAGIWPWLAALLGLIIVAAGAFVFWRRQQPAYAGVPEVERPTLRRESEPETPSPAASPAAAPASAPVAKTPEIAAADHKGLQIKVQALSLSRSVMNASLAFRLEVRNSAKTALENVTVQADLVTAHGRAPIEEQLATATTELAPMTSLKTLAAGEAEELDGNVRLPTNAIKLIPQGKAALYVPLLRLRVNAEGADPIIRTFVVGTKPPTQGAKLQPFRLDEMAQTYRNIGLRLLD